MSEPRIVSATGISCNSTSDNKPLAKAREKAMADAAAECHAAGISDPAEISKRMDAAYQAVKGG